MEQRNTRLRNAGFVTFFFSGICTISSGVVVSLLQEEYGFAYGMTGTLLSLLSIGNLLAGLLAGALVVSWDNYGFQESFAASLTCISNVGPGLGILGPMENFSILSPLSKLVLSLEMLMGRLELMPLLALFLGSTWRD